MKAPSTGFSANPTEEEEHQFGAMACLRWASVSIPPVGSLVVYFPQGHSEQVAASMQKDTDSIPSYPSLPSKLICLLHNVTLHADPETDEVYCDREAFLASDLGLKQNRQPSEFFCKTLTASDTSTHGGFSVPRRAAEKIFPPLDFSMQPPAQELSAKDLHDASWTFRHIYRGQPKRHLLTTGWSVFVGTKRLLAGDSVLFVRDEKSQLLLGVRRAVRQPPSLSSSVLSSDSMHIGILAAAAHAAANNSPFTIFYNPRATRSEFVIPLAKYYKAVYTQVSVGMRFRMMYMGTITGISDLDPDRWRNSQWRNLQVGWDESAAGERRSRVSVWEIEPVATPSTSASLLPAKLPRLPGILVAEFPAPRLRPPQPAAASSQTPPQQALQLPQQQQQQQQLLQPLVMARPPPPQQQMMMMMPPLHIQQQQQQQQQSQTRQQQLEQQRLLVQQQQLVQQIQLTQPQFQLQLLQKLQQQQQVLSQLSPHLQPQLPQSSGPLQGQLTHPPPPPPPPPPPLQEKPSGMLLSPTSPKHQQYFKPQIEAPLGLPSSKAQPGPPLMPPAEPPAGNLLHELRCRPDPCIKNEAHSAREAEHPTGYRHGTTDHLDASSSATSFCLDGGAAQESFSLPPLCLDSDIANVGLSPTPSSSRASAPAETFRACPKRGSVGRCIDVTRYKGYGELRRDLAAMFGIEGQLEDPHRTDWKLVYVDHENDILLVGDDPWEEFVSCVQSIKILSAAEVQQMSLDNLVNAPWITRPAAAPTTAIYGRAITTTTREPPLAVNQQVHPPYPPMRQELILGDPLTGHPIFSLL
ncbi:unnamed protein product [Spirodela intermedia]|uniref:Auxin response factor n=1 Tax=Spirodela intermedia TaxID=51605 RepID=A0A7I8J2Z7_SPIIN|nr:unnamed protein product [Spirodela intermedia]CAA6664617.1 unnamed protein product [Spirodela intermedia]